jgi:methylphosphotriester-DNA--protein-cysteine methyltransferase
MKFKPQTEHYGISSGIHEVSGLRLSERIYPANFKTPSHSHSVAYFCLILDGSSTQTYGLNSRVREPLTTAAHFSKVFKRLTGTTPANYRASSQRP